MVKYILDTDICSYILKRSSILVLDKFEQTYMTDISISVITYAELLFGAEKTKSCKVNANPIDAFVDSITLLPWDKNAAIEYSMMKNYLNKSGKRIDEMDLMIASHAKSYNLTLVTNNIKHFDRVPSLKLENWVNND